MDDDSGNAIEDAYPALSAFTPEEWRDRWIVLKKREEDVENDLGEIQAELERELEEKEKERVEMERRLGRYEGERDDWKLKYMTLQATHTSTTLSLQRELDTLRLSTTTYKHQLRDLEMGNDDLERNERVVKSSLMELEERYGRVVEEKTMLEHEVGMRAVLEEECQRLRDDLRDVNVEVAILRDREAQLRAQLSSRASSSTNLPSPVSQSSLTPSSSSVPVDLQLEDLTVTVTQKARPESARSDTEPDEARTRSEAVASPSITSLARRPTQPSSPSRLPTARRSIPPSGVPTLSSQSQPLRTSRTNQNLGIGAPPRSKGVQMVSDMRARVRSLEARISSRVPRPRAGTLARVSENSKSTASREPQASPAGSSSWVLVSDGSSNGTADASFTLVSPPTPAPVRPSSSHSSASATSSHPSIPPAPATRPGIDRRRSTEISPPPPTSFGKTERTRPLSQSQMPKRPGSRLSQLTASSSTAHERDFPARPQTPTFLPLPVSYSHKREMSQSSSGSSSSARLARRGTISTPHPPPAPSARSHASRPTSLQAPPVPPLPKHLEARPSAAGSLPSSSTSTIPPTPRFSRPNSLGVTRRPNVSLGASTALGLSKTLAAEMDEAELGVTGREGREKEAAIGLGRARARARASSGSGSGR